MLQKIIYEIHQCSAETTQHYFIKFGSFSKNSNLMYLEAIFDTFLVITQDIN